jgi:hypothetical protein
MASGGDGGGAMVSGGSVVDLASIRIPMVLLS